MITHDASKVDVNDTTVIWNKISEPLRVKRISDLNLKPVISAELKKMILENITTEEILTIGKRVYGPKAKTD